MSLLRKQTLPEMVSLAHQPSQKRLKKLSRLRSENWELGAKGQVSSKQTNLQNTDSSDLSLIKNAKRYSFEVENSQQLIAGNRLTINLCEATSFSSQLLEVGTFRKAAGLLISAQDYRMIMSYARGKENGRSALAELERQYDTRRAHFSLKKSSRVFIRNPNVVDELTDEEQQTNKVRLNKSKPSFTLPHSLPTTPITDKPNPTNRSRWFLKDFYDHISLDSHQSRNDRQKLRQDIFGKLKRINSSCQQVEVEMGEITKSVQVFEQFNDHLGKKLVKKLRRIDKISNFKFQ